MDDDDENEVRGRAMRQSGAGGGLKVGRGKRAERDRSNEGEK